MDQKDKKKMSAAESEIRNDIGEIVSKLSSFRESDASSVDRFIIHAMKQITAGLASGKDRKLELANEMRIAMQRKRFLDDSYTVKDLVKLSGLTDRGVRAMIRDLVKIEQNKTYYVPKFQFDFGNEKIVLDGLLNLYQKFPAELSSPIGIYNYFTKDNPRLGESPITAFKNGKRDQVLADIKGLAI